MDQQRQNLKWRARRRMAWISFFGILLIGAGAFIKPEAADSASGVLGAVVTLLGAIVVGYLSLSTYDDVKTQQVKGHDL